MQELITNNREKIADICRTHHVHRLAVFGSAVRDDFDEERSDVDFLVDFESVTEERYASNYFALEEALVALLSRRVDLLVSGSIRNPFIRSAIEAQQEILYAA